METIYLRVDKETKDELVHLAKNRKRSTNSLINQILINYLKNLKKKDV